MRRLFAAFSRYRPRVLTVVVLLIVAAVIALSNLSFDTGHFPQGAIYPIGTYGYQSYGWPVVWHRYILFVETYQNANNSTVSWHYGGARLAANLALWLGMLIAAAAASRWLQRRYPPRLRFSLRGLLAAVALIAAFCAWFVAARKRADVQEPLIAEITARGGRVMLERWGPKWLDLFGLDPLRRRIIGLQFTTNYGISEEEDTAEEAFLERVSRMSDLQYLFIETNHATPGLAAVLREMRQLRALSFEVRDAPEEQWIMDACLSAIAKMHELDHLYLSDASINGEHLAALKGLTKLKWLTLQSCHAPNAEEALLDRLPALPRLETLELFCSDVSDRDLPRLAALPRLKLLNLRATDVSEAGLAKLASLGFLEELRIESQWASPVGLKSLTTLKHLKTLHIGPIYSGSPKEAASPPERGAEVSQDIFGLENSVRLGLDHGDDVRVPKAERDACLNAIKTLRRKLPGLVIDSDNTAVYSFFSKHRLWHAHDATIGRRAAWLPLSDYPWGGPSATPAATRAECEAHAVKLGVPLSF